MIKPLVLSVLCFFLASCTVRQAIVADSLTTAYGIQSGKAEEANPLMPKSAAGAALGSLLVKEGVLALAKRHSSKACKSVAAGVYASSVGATVNNGLVIGGEYKAAPVAGVTAGMFAFKKSRSPADRFCN